MMKITTSTLFTVSLLFVCFFLAQPLQAQWGERGSGNVVEQKRDHTDFTGVSVQSGMDLYITQGNEFSVVVVVDDNLQDNILTDVYKGNLRVKLEGNFSKSNQMEIRVTLPRLTHLQASGGSDIFGQNAFTIDDLNIQISGGSDAKLDLRGNKLILQASGGSDMLLEGKVNEIQAEVSGGSDIKAKNLVTAICRVQASGGSDAWVHATQEADLSASGSSDIHIYGKPGQLRERTSSASDIHRM